MKAHWNMRSSFNFIPHSLAVLCCLALLVAIPAQAQEDNNGRPPGLAPGAPVVEAAPAPVDDVNAACDYDNCGKANRVAPQTEGQTLVDGVGARMLSQTASLSFQIHESAPKNSVHVAEDGNIGIGTDTPAGRFHIVAQPDADGASDLFVLDNNGNLEIGGLLTEASSVLLKENFEAVDVQDVLRRLASLPVSTWNYKTDDDGIRHMGPMAQDFYAAFGLGKDDAHIAPLDANGVAMAAAQALAQQVQTQAAQIETLEAQNAALLQRLEALEALVHQRNK